MPIPVVFLKKDGHYYYHDRPDVIADDEALSIVIGPKSGHLRIETVSCSIVKSLASQIKDAEEVKESISYNYPDISFDVYWRTLCFLRKVYKEHGSEANVLLVLNRDLPLEDQEYKIVIPEQEVSSHSVDYAAGIRKIQLADGEFFAGSIHSHPGFSAFQSGTDHADEIFFEGLHLTFGNIDKTPIEIDERVCLAGEVYKPKKSCIHTEPPQVDIVVPAELTDKIDELEAELFERGIKVDIGNIIGKCIKKESYPEFDVPAEWMACVSKKYASYSPTGYPGYTKHWTNGRTNAVLGDDVADIDDYMVYVGTVANKDICRKIEQTFENLYKPLKSA